MKYKIPILLALLVLIPLVSLGWLGARLQSNEQIVLQHQAQQLALARLREAEQAIDSYFDAVEQESLESLAFLEPGSGSLNQQSVEAIRTLIQTDPLLEQVFVLSQSGDRLFPPHADLASRKEQAFVQTTQALWADEDMFRAKIPETSNQQVPATKLKRTRISQASPDSYAAEVVALPNDSPVQVARGWVTWDVGNATQTFFWFRDINSNLIGQQLAPAFWTAELINRLPDHDVAAESLGNARIKLVDKKQRVIYQWGVFDEADLNGVQPQAQRLLDHPLDGWRLAYFAPSMAGATGFKLLIFVALFGALGVMLMTLGLYMWREYRRDMRVAEQRVTFVNQVSHELKTPLTNICMYADMLESEVQHDATVNRDLVHKYSGVVRAESQRLGRLINNVLSFSKARKQGAKLQPATHSIDDVIRETVDVFAPAFAAAGIQAELILNAPQYVQLDAGALEQVLNNLLSNVEKYAADGKRVEIRSRHIDGVTEIEVEDAGRGLGDKNSERLFEPFVRGGDRLTEGVTGAGIGLSIARELCRLHGGELAIKPTSKGACFVITLSTPLEESGQ